jgi:hypothetical protein
MGKAIIVCSKTVLWHLLESDVEDNEIKRPGSHPRSELELLNTLLSLSITGVFGTKSDVWRNAAPQRMTFMK